MNLGVPQYKNYWKWGHMTFSYYIQEPKCMKCNSSYKIEYYHHFDWCCKVNFKINSLYLETKQDELYLYSFKCLNCKSNYQADLNTYPFWKYYNKE